MYEGRSKEGVAASSPTENVGWCGNLQPKDGCLCVGGWCKSKLFHAFNLTNASQPKLVTHGSFAIVQKCMCLNLKHTIVLNCQRSLGMIAIRYSQHVIHRYYYKVTQGILNIFFSECSRNQNPSNISPKSSPQPSSSFIKFSTSSLLNSSYRSKYCASPAHRALGTNGALNRLCSKLSQSE